MADVIPFRTKSEPPSSSKCSTSSRCSQKLTCPACDYVACSTMELHTHIAKTHPPVER